jgi:hypothetical protein
MALLPLTGTSLSLSLSNTQKLADYCDLYYRYFSIWNPKFLCPDQNTSSSNNNDVNGGNNDTPVDVHTPQKRNNPITSNYPSLAQMQEDQSELFSGGFVETFDYEKNTDDVYKSISETAVSPGKIKTFINGCEDRYDIMGGSGLGNNSTVQWSRGRLGSKRKSSR